MGIQHPPISCTVRQKQHSTVAVERREPVLFMTAFAANLSLEDIADNTETGHFTDKIDAKDFIARFINALHAREERIIRLRFGLDGVGEHTLDEIATLFGCGKENIRRLEIRALRKLRYRARRTYPSRMMHIDEDVANRNGAVLTKQSPQRRDTNAKRARQTVTYVPRVSESGDAGDARRTMLYREWQAERSEMARTLAIEAEAEQAKSLAFANADTASPRRGLLWRSVTSIHSWLGKTGKPTRSANEGLTDA
jgi:Sigma-70, region 4